MKFKVGQTVEWSSQAAGSMTTKRGKIIAVVPAGQKPKLRDFDSGYTSAIHGYCFSRNHESYVVAVPGKTPRALPRVYWPRVSGLKLVEATGAEAGGRER